MANSGDITALTLALILAGWMAAAIIAIWIGLSRKAQADAILRQSGRLGRLLETSPSLPLMVRSDGRLEGSQRLARWLGFDSLPGHISELSGSTTGLPAEDLKCLQKNVSLAQKSGESFEQVVKVTGGDHCYRLKGGKSDNRIASQGVAIIWFTDVTDSERDRKLLTEDRDRASADFKALSVLIESAPIPMWHRDASSKLSLVNAAYVQAVEAEDSRQVVERQMELLDQTDAMPPGGDQKNTASGSISRNQPQDRISAATISGQRRMVRLVDVPLPGGEMAGYAIDVQQLEDVKSALARFGESQRTLLDMMSAGVAQFDAEQCLSFSNLPFQRAFSMRQQWLLDRPEFPRLLDRIREMNRLPEVRDFPAWRKEREQWFHSPQPAEETWTLPDGTHFRVLANPLPDGGLLLLFEDRTEQVRLAGARDTLLRVRAATFDNLFETIAVFTSDGKLSIWNRKFAKCWDLEEADLDVHPRIDAIMQKMARQLKNPAKISELRELVRSATTDRQQRSGKLIFVDKRVFDAATIPLPDGNALLTMLDVTDSSRMEQALRERNEALIEADEIKGNFLANMSYEFRTPLTSIGGFAEMLDHGLAGPLSEQGRDYVRAILESVQRLGAQIDNVLDLSQSEAGALPISKEKHDVRALVEECVSAFAVQAKASEIDLELQLDERLGSAMVDRKRFAQALMQIIDNAIRYSGHGARILINGSGTVQKAIIHVSDNGPGMTTGQQSRAFDSFARSREKKSVQSGGGLGLPLARQLILAHGGDLKLVSEPGQGTLVTISIPRK